ncbi:MAG: hypothetical protein JXL97_06945 [Bacteroidales bacterium]|nr:hypothetical protein [Bacteroidales bacterium]
MKNRISANAKFVVVLASWCSDSRREVSFFFKIFDAIDFDQSRVSVIAVGKDFYAGDNDVAQYQIDKVPTIICFHYGYEAGRIIESPKISLEKDLVDFTKRKGKN